MINTIISNARREQAESKYFFPNDKNYLSWFIWEEIKVRMLFAICKIKGHQLVDDDPGNPEVGPQPNVYCKRCGCQF